MEEEPEKDKEKEPEGKEPEEEVKVKPEVSHEVIRGPGIVVPPDMPEEDIEKILKDKAEDLEREKKAVVAKDWEDQIAPIIAGIFSGGKEAIAQLEELVKAKGAICEVTLKGTYRGLPVTVSIRTLTKQLKDALWDVAQVLDHWKEEEG